MRLSTGEEFIAGERERVEALGMQFVSLPWRAADVPTEAQVRTFLDLFRGQPAQPSSSTAGKVRIAPA